MEQKRKSLVVASVLILMVLGLLLPEGARALSLGEEAPPFMLQLFKGGMLTLTGLRGKPVVLNFWASW
ncbi:MAG: TlpA family protein disulfide reductase [Candidatus Methylomirabilales bacterium]